MPARQCRAAQEETVAGPRQSPSAIFPDKSESIQKCVAHIERTSLKYSENGRVGPKGWPGDGLSRFERDLGS